jgi:hypothetical protein
LRAQKFQNNFQLYTLYGRLPAEFGANVFISEYYSKDNSENNKIIPSENASGTFMKSTNKW